MTGNLTENVEKTEEKNTVKREDFYFLSKEGQTKIHAIRWWDETVEPKAVLQIVHGMQEYIERYEEFAAFLCAQGYVVVGHDHLGHGDSVKDENEYGYFAKKKPSATLVADVKQLQMLTASAYPNIPYFIFGHSMGSYILRRFLSVHGKTVDAAIICGTGKEDDFSCRMGLAFIRLLSAIRGDHYVSKLVARMAQGKGYDEYDISDGHFENSWLSRDVDKVKEFLFDSRSQHMFTLNGYYGLVSTVSYDNQKANIDRIPKDLPIFMIAGDNDPVGKKGESVKQVYEEYKEAGIKDITLKLYPGARHELTNETNRQEVFADVLAWLNEKMK